MKSLAISTDRDVLTGLRLAGIEGEFAKDKVELKEIFNQRSKDPSIGILIVMEEDFKALEADITEVKLHQVTPLVVMIPGMEGLHDHDFILRYIKSSVGVSGY